MTRPQGSAARELGLKRGEFDLAVRLGRIRTVAAPDGGLRRVPREEIDRIREAEGFPDALREQVRVVGTAQGASIMDIPSSRFTRLARAGLLRPAKFYVNRYRTVVWLYLAEELREFARSEVHAPLLTGRAPAEMRVRIAAGEDLRPRTWRARHAGYLLGQCGDPWERAAAITTFLDADLLAEMVESPRERTHLLRLRPHESWYGAPDSPTAQVVERILVADGPDEISWLRTHLLMSLDKARRLRPAPPLTAQRPALNGPRTPEDPTRPENFTIPAPAEPARSLWGRLLGRRG
ncbi:MULTISPECIES: DUF6397 family protein [unclassified Streptomyces]|uniref:DUF6397 family protein n=1 Tax=unclassified Streptomyces TaxID=2593676 RepID=UPI000DC4A4FA|nr:MULTISPECIES: DUF6397 family protein [unclassified Streptomyces]RAJ86982.1 hypothetical protein K377_02663 [Streptomyces sp. PsTaAH-137]